MFSPSFLSRFFGTALAWPRLAKLSWVLLAAPICLLAFYNLAYAPRSWQDEGAAMSVARTLTEDGVYATRSSEGYQTFGAIQSVGPTVLLPIALSFKLFGVGLVQGRVVMAAYMLATLAVFAAATRALFGDRAALVGVLLLISTPAVYLLHHGRQALGEVPALGFFLAGWLAWRHGIRTGRPSWYPLAGLLLGLAIVTKSQYAIMGFGTIGLLVVLDLFYYRQRRARGLIAVGVVAGACVALWVGWQIAYYGMATFQEDSAKLRQLASVQFALDPRSSFGAIKYLLGPDSGNFYYFWGLPALIYAAALAGKRDEEGFTLAFLVVFSLLWLSYFIVLIIPWPRYALAATAITAIFVAKLWHDLTDGFHMPWRAAWAEISQARPARAALQLAALLGLAVMVGYPLQSMVRTEVLARDRSTVEIADLLNRTVDRTAIVETWERELGVMTNHRYHFADQALLAKTHAATYRGGPRDYALGLPYFLKYRPQYLVIGWYAREAGLYDPAFLAGHARLLATIGDGELRYELYQLQLP